MHFNRVCVFCGSSRGNGTFAVAANELGKELLSRGAGLVYGGGSVGLMGEIAKTVSSGGGDVLGIIPLALEPVELSGQSVGEVVVVRDMHERKQLMAEKSDSCRTAGWFWHT